PPRLAAPALLANQDLCILVNVSLTREPTKGVEGLAGDFVDELSRFVRQGHGLIMFAGDNVEPAAYNRVFGKAGLLPLPIKSVIERPFDDPLLFNRDSIALASYQPLKEGESYKLFGLVPTWKALLLDEVDSPNSHSVSDTKKTEKPLTIAVRYSNGQP